MQGKGDTKMNAGFKKCSYGRMMLQGNEWPDSDGVRGAVKTGKEWKIGGR